VGVGEWSRSEAILCLSFAGVNGFAIRPSSHLQLQLFYQSMSTLTAVGMHVMLVSTTQAAHAVARTVTVDVAGVSGQWRSGKQQGKPPLKVVE